MKLVLEVLTARGNPRRNNIGLNKRNIRGEIAEMGKKNDISIQNAFRGRKKRGGCQTDHDGGRGVIWNLVVHWR